MPTINFFSLILPRIVKLFQIPMHLQDFLQKYPCPKDDKAKQTHVYGRFRYNVPYDQLANLFRTVEIERTLSRSLGQRAFFENFNEFNNPDGPYKRFVVDIDIDVTDDKIQSYVECVYTGIEEYIGKNDKLEFAVLRRDNETYGRVHIHFINLVVCVKTFDKLMKIIKQKHGEKSVDAHAGKHTFLIYGSAKNFCSNPLKAKFIPYTVSWWGSYSAKNNFTRHDKLPHDNLDAWQAVNLAHLLSLRRPVIADKDIVATSFSNKQAMSKNIISDLENKKKDDDYMQLRSRKRSIPVTVEDDDDDDDEGHRAATKRARGTNGGKDSTLTVTQKEFAKVMVNSWSYLASDYNSWFRIICAIVNTIGYEDAKYAQSLAESFSRQCPEKYDQKARDTIEKLIEEVTDKKERRRYFRNENPLDENERRMERLLIKSEKVHRGRSEWYTHLCQYIFGDINIISTESPTNSFETIHIWYDKIESCYVFFTQELLTKLYRSEGQGKILDLFSKLLCKYFNDKIQFGLIWNIRKPFEENYDAVGKELFLRIPSTRIAREIFDRRKRTMVFLNGALDLETGTFIHRNEENEKYFESFYNLAINSNNYEPLDPRIRNNMVELMQLLKKIFPDEETLEVFIRWLTKCLLTGNTWRSLLVIRGNRRNGKTLLQKIIAHAFRSKHLCINIQPSAMQNDPGSLMTDFAQCLGEERVIILSEFAFDCSERAYNLIKSITGGDRIQYRIPYERATSGHEIMGQVIVTTNARGGDFHLCPQREAVIDRIKIIPLESIFVNKDEYNEYVRVHGKKNNVYMDDSSLMSQECLEKYGEALINYLVFSYINDYKCEMQTSRSDVKSHMMKFLNNGPPADSKRMKRAKREILQACDNIYQFCANHLQYEKGATQSLDNLFKMYEKTRNKWDGTKKLSFFQDHVWTILKTYGWLGKTMQFNVTRRIVRDCNREVHIYSNCVYRELRKTCFM